MFYILSDHTVTGVPCVNYAVFYSYWYTMVRLQYICYWGETWV